MKKIMLGCLILFCFSFVVFGQGANKKVDSQIAEAEKAWKVFFPKFKKAVVDSNYDLIKSQMKKRVLCPVDDPLDTYDNRDECLNSLKNSAAYWNEFAKTLSGKICKLSIGDINDDYKFSRVVVESGCSADHDFYIGFDFIKGLWYLSSFGMGEGS